MDNYKFPRTGEGPMVPPLSGLRHSLTNNIRPEPGIATRGLYISRIKFDQHVLTTSLALANVPGKSQAYLRLLAIQWIDPTGKGPNSGLAIEGDPWAPDSSQGTGKILRRGYDPEELPAIEKAGMLIEAVVRGLRAYGAMKGNRTDAAKVAAFVDEGLMDIVLGGTLMGRATEVINLCNPDHMCHVEDLNYETSLGIQPEPEPVCEPPEVVATNVLHDVEHSTGKTSIKFPVIPSSGTWDFYELPQAIIAADMVKAIKHAPDIHPELSGLTRELLQTWPRLTSYVGFDKTRPYYSGYTERVPVAPDPAGYGGDPRTLFRPGDTGFYGIQTGAGFITMRSEGICIYNSPELYHKVKHAARHRDGEALFPSPSEGWKNVDLKKIRRDIG